MIKNLLYFVVFTSVVVLSWIAFGVYHNYTASTISNDTSILITPIPPNFDSQTIESLTTRAIIPADLTEKTIQATATSTLTPIPSPIPKISSTPILTISPANPVVASPAAGL